MQKWYTEDFSTLDPRSEKKGLMEVMSFANKHGLKPEEFKIGPMDKHWIITILYYSDRQLEK